MNEIDLITSLFSQFALFIFLLCIFHLLLRCKMFMKMGLEGWKALIPFYNAWLMHERIFGNGLYMFVPLLGVIPIIGNIILILYSVIFCLRLCKSFAREPAFTVGLFFLPIVFEAILAFGKAEYEEISPYDFNHPFT